MNPARLVRLVTTFLLSLTLVIAAPALASAAPAITSGHSSSSSDDPVSKLPREVDPGVQPAACNSADLPTGQARCYAEFLTRTRIGKVLTPMADAPPAAATTPAQLRDAYNLPDGGEGRTVAVVDAGGYAAAENDLAVFRRQYGMPECTTANGCFRKVDQDGGTNYPADNPGWASETALDLDAVSAVCPRCHLLLVEADNASIASLSAAADRAVALGAKYVSNSYGVPGEQANELDYDKFYDHPGVVMTASTGDTGYVSNWPAASPNVLAVGGTTLTQSTGTARGWAESAWSDGGSGCSPYEQRPDYQKPLDTGCPTGKATADLSADADPHTGLAVYDSLPDQGRSGWSQFGGTSLSSPLIAAMYALAGTPASSTYPVQYPYAAAGTSGLNDVTTGKNADCGTVLCTAGKGWDGPTGLGTPNGVSALSFGPAGTVTGHITDSSTGKPLSAATITAEETDSGKTYRETSDENGAYALKIPAGSYTVTTAAYGYAKSQTKGVIVTVDKTTTADVALHSVPSHVVSGTITGDTDHPWPLSASIAIDGYPGQQIATDPVTGRYSVSLPDDADYTFRVSATAAGYQQKTVPVSAGNSNKTVDTHLTVDRQACTAPGYAYPLQEDFEGWHQTNPADGWSTSGSNPGWQFNGQPANLLGTAGNFASAAPFINDGAAEDTYLTSPPIDLSGQDAPELRFASLYLASVDGPSSADVQLSLDNGGTWATVGHPGHATTKEAIALPEAANKSGVRIRLHYLDSGVSVWQVDDLVVGSCSATPGGLIAGTVQDANTGKPIASATVNGSPTTDVGTYSTFAAKSANLTAEADRYAASTQRVTVRPDSVTRTDWELRAGRLSVSPGKASMHTTLGKRGRTSVLLRNTGTAPMHITLGEHSGATPAAATGWTDIPNYPIPIDSPVAGRYQGKVYVAGGFTAGSGTPHVVSAANVYDPATAKWTSIADLPQPLTEASGTFLNGTLYVVGGRNTAFAPSTALYAYHPATDTWTRMADVPEAVARASVAVLDEHLYVVGGCLDKTGGGCAEATSAAYRYDPASNSWHKIANYPVATKWHACAGLTGQIVCAGGSTRETDQDGNLHFALNSTYSYNPDSNGWTRLADMPYRDYGMAYSGADGKLQIAGGVSDYNAFTQQAAEFDPVTDKWHMLPDTRQPFLTPGSSCGMYQIGGSSGSLQPMAASSVLPGYDACGGDNVPWLSENRTSVDLKPGHSARVMLTGDARDITQPGKFDASLSFETDSPYSESTMDVRMQVSGRLSGRPVADFALRAH